MSQYDSRHTFTPDARMDYDTQLSLIIHSALVQFKEDYIEKGTCPPDFLPIDRMLCPSEEAISQGFADYLVALDKMIYAFDMSNEPVLENGMSHDMYRRSFMKHDTLCEEGRGLFAEHFNTLWV